MCVLCFGMCVVDDVDGVDRFGGVLLVMVLVWFLLLMGNDVWWCFVVGWLYLVDVEGESDIIDGGLVGGWGDLVVLFGF